MSISDESFDVEPWEETETKENIVDPNIVDLEAETTESLNNEEEPLIVAGVGSPSTNFELTLDLSRAGRDTPLVGQTVSVTNPLGAGDELALGTVTDVTTKNKWHEDSDLRGAFLDSGGTIPGHSGDDGDTRTATIRLQAAWSRETPEDNWKPSGPSLRMSPATGQPIRTVDNRLLREITATSEDIHYNGFLGGTTNVPLPLSIPDFSGSLGAFHSSYYGKSGSGKALSCETPIPTPFGWTTMGDLKQGDTVFDEEGNPCSVVIAHPVMNERPCYMIEFSGGSTIIADADHMWETELASGRSRSSHNVLIEATQKTRSLLPSSVVAKIRNIAKDCSPLDVITIAEVKSLTGIGLDSIVVRAVVNRVGVAGQVQSIKTFEYAGVTPPKTIGTPRGFVFTYPKASFLNTLANFCEPVSNGLRADIESTLGVRTTEEIANTLWSEINNEKFANHSIKIANSLKTEKANLPIDPRVLGSQLARGEQKTSLNSKAIPQEYLRASEIQRQELLAGLLSVDNIPPSTQNEAFFNNADERLVEDVYELVVSLGYRPTVKLEGSIYCITWPTIDLEKSNKRYIVNVHPVESVPVRCITVDSPNHLYLAGRSMIPTHNTATVSYSMAAQLRFPNHGIIIVDPQGQFSSEVGLPFSLQGWAAELGREVQVHRISEDLRLPGSPELFVRLLHQTSFFTKLSLKHPQTIEIVGEEVEQYLRQTEEWNNVDSRELLTLLLSELISEKVISRIYNNTDNAKRWNERMTNILEDPALFNTVFVQWQPVRNLFEKTNASGTVRHSLWNTLSAVFDRAAGEPAPLLILDMSTKLPGAETELTPEMENAYRILEKDSVKAAILRSMFSNLKHASEQKFKDGQSLNTMVVLDEAWRYAAPVRGGSSDANDEVALLSTDLAGYARDTRKFGIGWCYISQSPKSLNAAIADQLHVQVFGYGLTGSDLDRVVEMFNDRSAIRLYQGFADPRSSGVWPFLLAGPVSPLLATNAPLVMNSFTNFDDFRRTNVRWIKEARDAQGLPLLSGTPVKPSSALQAGVATTTKRKKVQAPKDTTKALIDTSRAAQKNRSNVGVQDPGAFSNPLDQIDVDEEEDSPF